MSTVTLSRPAFRRIVDSITRYGVYFILAVMVVVFGLANPLFLTVPNLMNILQQTVPVGIAAVGVTFVLVTGGIDLSIGQNMYLTAVVCGVTLEFLGTSGLAGTPTGNILVVLAAVATGTIVGAVNGLLVSYFKIVPFIATLATTGLVRGAGLIISGAAVYEVPQLADMINFRIDFNIGQFPVVVLVLASVVALFHYLLRNTPFGMSLMAIGGDSRSAGSIGVPVRRNTFFAYTICGSLAGLAGMVMAGQVASVAVYFADGTEFLAISAAVLGGISLFGGRGRVWPGALIGVFLVTVIVNGMAMMSASPYAYKVVRGAIIFFAVMVDSVHHRGDLR